MLPSPFPHLYPYVCQPIAHDSSPELCAIPTLSKPVFNLLRRRGTNTQQTTLQCHQSTNVQRGATRFACAREIHFSAVFKSFLHFISCFCAGEEANRDNLAPQHDSDKPLPKQERLGPNAYPARNPLIAAPIPPAVRQLSSNNTSHKPTPPAARDYDGRRDGTETGRRRENL